ncbi:hypothetical protein GVAV_002752 [Gurleya vavrai]
MALKSLSDSWEGRIASARNYNFAFNWDKLYRISTLFKNLPPNNQKIDINYALASDNVSSMKAYYYKNSKWSQKNNSYHQTSNSDQTRKPR